MQMDPTLLGGGLVGLVGLLTATTRLVVAIKAAATEVKSLVGAVGINSTETKNLADQFAAYQVQTTDEIGALDKRVTVLEGAFPQWPAKS